MIPPSLEAGPDLALSHHLRYHSLHQSWPPEDRLNAASSMEASLRCHPSLRTHLQHSMYPLYPDPLYQVKEISCQDLQAMAFTIPTRLVYPNPNTRSSKHLRTARGTGNKSAL
jgi:hypothetical protein